MASVYSHGAFFFCIAITIAYAFAADNRNAADDCFTASIKSICDATSSPGSCNHPFDPTRVSQPKITLRNLINSTMDQLSKVSPDFATNGEIERLINSSMPNNGLALSALGSCRELISLAMYNFNKSLSSPLMTDVDRDDVTSWVCAGGSNLQTCIDEFGEQPQGVRKVVIAKLEKPIYLTRNSSTIMAIIDRCSRRSNVHSSKTDLLVGDSRDHYPHWLSSKDRRFLQGSNMVPNVVVAADGSGNYKRISDALKAVPRYSRNRFVIYVKKGYYRERVKVEPEQWNVMMYGDGMDQTIIFNDQCHSRGAGTWDSATFSKFCVIHSTCLYSLWNLLT